MVNKNDPRFVPGNTVHTRTKLITAEVNCRRLFRALSKTKLVPGSVVTKTTKLVHGRKPTLLTVTSTILAERNLDTLHISSFKAGEPPLQTISMQPTHPIGAPFDEDNVDSAEVEIIDLVVVQTTLVEKRQKEANTPGVRSPLGSVPMDRRW